MKRDRKSVRHVSNSDIHKILAKLKMARQSAAIETSNFGDICRPNSETTVKESNVTEFIRERCRIHHQSWIIHPLDEVIELLEAKLLASDDD